MQGLSARRGRAERVQQAYDTYESPLGILYLTFEGRALVGVSLERPHARAGAAPEEALREMDAYFSGGLREFTVDVRFPDGTPFEHAVWLALRGVPYAETRSYKWLASVVGRPRGARAVGQALSRNPIPIVLPCHRIVESGGSIGGYSSGVELKRRLLKMEYYYSIGGPRTAGP